MENKATGLNELSLADYFNIFYKWRRSIVSLAVAVAVVAAGISLILPKTYTATAVVMPPAPGIGMLPGASVGASLTDIGSLFGGINDETNRSLAILKSRTMAASVIQEFDLIERYQKDYVEDAIKTLEKRMDISVDDEGMIKVAVSAKTGYLHIAADEEEARSLAANMANFIIDKLDQINASLQTQQARYTRLLIERLYNKNKDALVEIEKEMKSYGESYGIFSLPEQMSAAVLAAAALEEQITLREVEFEVARSLLAPNHPEVKGLEIQLREFRRKLNEMKYGGPTKDALAVFPLLREAPDLGIMYARLTRRLETESLIYQFLTQQYEQAKVQEAKDTPTMQVLDRAVVPVRKSKPFRALIVVVSVLVAGTLQAFYILVKERKIVIGTV